MQNTVHFVVQGKGGIGKSFVSVLLAQYFLSKNANLRAFDTDQENTTFAHYKALRAEHVAVMDDSRTINPKLFDQLMEKILLDEDGGTFVIDNGANTFSPLLAYMVENDIISMLTEAGKKVYLHTIIGGGDAFLETANGFNSIASAFEGTPVVLWMNAHFGKLETKEGTPFEETRVFKKNYNSLAGIVVLPERNPRTYGDDIRRLNIARLTANEAIQSTEFSLMERNRIKTVIKDVDAQLDKIDF